MRVDLSVHMSNLSSAKRLPRIVKRLSPSEASDRLSRVGWDSGEHVG